MATQEKPLSKAEKADAARNRDTYARGLQKELEAVKAQGKTERVAAVEAELKRIGEKPQGRSSSATVTAAQKKAQEKAALDQAAAEKAAADQAAAEAAAEAAGS